MKAKVIRGYRFSTNGVSIHELHEGDVVEGDIAKRLVDSGIAKKTESKSAVAVFNDDGPVVDDSEELTIEQAQEKLTKALKELEFLEQEIVDKGNELYDLNESIQKAESALTDLTKD